MPKPLIELETGLYLLLSCFVMDLHPSCFLWVFQNKDQDDYQCFNFYQEIIKRFPVDDRTFIERMVKIENEQLIDRAKNVMKRSQYKFAKMVVDASEFEKEFTAIFGNKEEENGTG